jgi:hypothetical protein
MQLTRALYLILYDMLGFFLKKTFNGILKPKVLIIVGIRIIEGKRINKKKLKFNEISNGCIILMLLNCFFSLQCVELNNCPFCILFFIDPYKYVST